MGLVHTIQCRDQVEVDLRVEEGLEGWSDIVGMVMIFAMAVTMIMVMRHCKICK
jgi:hypothetical protein